MIIISSSHSPCFKTNKQLPLLNSKNQTLNPEVRNFSQPASIFSIWTYFFAMPNKYIYSVHRPLYSELRLPICLLPECPVLCHHHLKSYPGYKTQGSLTSTVRPSWSCQPTSMPLTVSNNHIMPDTAPIYGCVSPCSVELLSLKGYVQWQWFKAVVL